MPALSASAPGKIILFGEHAVVYGRPAIATPVLKVRAKTIIIPNPRGAPGCVKIQAPDIDLEAYLHEMSGDEPLAMAVNLVCSTLNVSRIPACTLRITSTIPIASGLGSGASVTIAVMRALSSFFGHPLSDRQVSALAFEVEKLHHGTPSGIDNTVISYARPVFFQRPQDKSNEGTIQILKTARSFTIVIGDTGRSSPTAITVRDVRLARQSALKEFEHLFDLVGEVTFSARAAIEAGNKPLLGSLMDKNHYLLQKIGVSSPELDHLVQVARETGALGAKLSGSGRGGNMIALVSESESQAVAEALRIAGATNTIITKTL